MRRIPACLSVPLLWQTFLHNLLYFIQCINVAFPFESWELCSEVVKNAYSSWNACLTVLEAVGISLCSYLWKGKSIILGTSRKVLSNYTWTVTCRTNLSDFFPVEYSSAIVHPSSRGNGGICLELWIQSRLFSTKFIRLVYKLCVLHPFNFVLQ